MKMSGELAGTFCDYFLFSAANAPLTMWMSTGERSGIIILYAWSICVGKQMNSACSTLITTTDVPLSKTELDPWNAPVEPLGGLCG